MRRLTHAILTLTTIAVASVVDSATSCAELVFDDRNSFLLASGPLSHEGFEDEMLGLTQGNQSIDFEGFTGTYLTDEADPNNFFGVSSNVNANGSGPTGGLQYLFSSFGPSASTTFDFDEAVLEFGTDIKDLETGVLFYELSTGATGIAGGPLENGDVQFFGVVDAMPFSWIRFTKSGPNPDSVIFDEVAFSATAVPEPSSLMILSVASLSGLFAAARRRRSVAVRLSGIGK